MKSNLGYVVFMTLVVLFVAVVFGGGAYLFFPNAAIASDDNDPARLLARELMGGDYAIEATAGPYVVIIRKDDVLYKCGMNDRLTACRQISMLGAAG